MIWVSIAAAATLSGGVADPDGAPVADAVVVAYDVRFASVVARSDAAGRFTVDGLAAGRWRLRILPPVASGLGERWALDDTGPCGAAVWTLGDDEVVDVGAIGLPAGATIVGRVVDADGAPLPGVTLRAEATLDDSVLNPGEAVSDADGRFVLDGLVPEGPAGDFVVRATGKGIPVQWLPGTYDEDRGEAVAVEPGGSVDVGDFVLLPGITVGGAVSGPDGPVDGGYVTVYSASRALAAPVEGGRYVVRGLPPGEVTAWATLDGLSHGFYPGVSEPGPRVSVLDEGGESLDVDLDLPAERTLVGQVVPALADAPRDLGLLAFNESKTVGIGERAATDGSFVLHNLWEGPYTVYVYGARAGGENGRVLGADGSPLVVRADGPEAPVALVVPPLGRIRGHVTDADGAAIPDVVVELDGPTWTYAVTDLDGAYQVDALPAGDYVATAYLAPYCPNDPGAVQVWWPEVLREADAGALGVVNDVATIGDRAVTWDVVLGRDADRDGMDDAWERANGLDPAVNDAGADRDGDRRSNLDEFLAGTDPDEPAARACGCGTPGVGGLAWLGILSLRRRRSGMLGAETPP